MISIPLTLVGAVMMLIWVLLIAFAAGIGWTFGCWLAGKVLR